MKRTIMSGVGLIALVATGCGKKESSSIAVSTASVVTSGAPAATSTPAIKSAESVALAPPTVANTKEAPPATGSDLPPDSFSGAETVTNAVATSLGCEAKSKDGWIQLLCRKKNGNGGHPTRAVIGTESDAPEVVPDAQGELKVVLSATSESSGVVEWTDTKYNLKVKGGELKLDWSVTLEMRRACAELEKASKLVVSQAQKAESSEHLTPTESAKLPRFGICQPAGHGSWALGLRGIEATGANSARAISLEVDVLRVAEDGSITKADFGKVTTRVGGFELRPLQVYDYDDDGSVELIVPFDIKAIPSGTTPVALSGVWSANAGQVNAFARFAPTIAGLQTTHLEYDMRPDLGTYEPFVAYLGDDCGAANCPTRLVGPARFARSMPKGEFSLTDAQSQAALNRTCQKSAVLVVEGNPTRTAQLVGCARLRNEESTKIEAELKSKASKLCKGGDSCPLLDALVKFATVDLPAAKP